jgi:hypothetical protein
MPTQKEEEEEQKFFAEQLKKQEKEHKMAKENDEPKARDTSAGYSGSAHEGKKFERAEGASKEAVVSEVGTTEPTVEFGGDGVTPLAEFDKKMESVRKQQAEHDEKMRQRAREDSGVIQTTTKHAVDKGKHNG